MRLARTALALLSAFAFAQIPKVAPLANAQDGPSYHQWQGWFNEAKLDHFDLTNDQTFSQRYFVIKDFWKPPHGPVIL